MALSLDQARAALAGQPFSRLFGAQLNRFGRCSPAVTPVKPAAHLPGHGPHARNQNSETPEIVAQTVFVVTVPS